MHILLIEDERPVAQAVTRLLTDSGYHVEWVRNGLDGLQAAESKNYDLIILDVLLPGLSGWEVCGRLRESQVNTQILILSAMDEPGDATRGLDLGADDYLCKPFDPAELLARVRARGRTGRAHLSRLIRIGDLELDRVKHTVQASGQPIPLSRPEYAVLERLAADAGQPVPAQVLAREVDYSPDPLADPLEYCIASLQRKMSDWISMPVIHQTADGYVLDADELVCPSRA